MSQFVFDDRHDPDTEDVIEVKARSPRDVLAAAAALLRFHPQDSIVALAMSGRRVIGVARGDLPASSVDRAHRTAIVDKITTPMVGAGADGLVLIGYGLAHPVTTFMDVAVGHIQATGTQLWDALRVTDGRYFSYRCYDVRCCPIEGVPFDLDTSAVTAHVVMSGGVVERDRSVLVNSIAPESDQVMRAMRWMTRAAGRRVCDLVATRGRAAAALLGAEVVATALTRYEGGGRLADDEMAELLVHLVNPGVRDVACAADVAGPWHEELWCDATRRAVAGLVAAPATLLAFTAWRRGNGALANIAVERALADDPGYTLAALILQVLNAGLPPSVLSDEPGSRRQEGGRRRYDSGRSDSVGDVNEGDTRSA